MELEKIWSEYKAGLSAFLHSKIANHHDVEDLLQEVLLKTHQKLGQVESEGSIKSWLYQVANHTIIDFYRRKGRQPDLAADDLWHSESQPDVKQELSHCVDPFVKALDRQHSELLMAIDLNGESQKEYAASLGISYSTLKSRVKKARSELRHVFEDCCHMKLDAQGNLMDYEHKKKETPRC